MNATRSPFVQALEDYAQAHRALFTAADRCHVSRGQTPAVADELRIATGIFQQSFHRLAAVAKQRRYDTTAMWADILTLVNAACAHVERVAADVRAQKRVPTPTPEVPEAPWTPGEPSGGLSVAAALARQRAVEAAIATS